jgi:hypothetical protein
MPLEIRELYIKVTVNQPPQQGQAPTPEDLTDTKKQDNDKEAIISQCLDEMVRIMNNKKER